jgi:hypothetical protein
MPAKAGIQAALKKMKNILYMSIYLQLFIESSLGASFRWHDTQKTHPKNFSFSEHLI